MSALSLQLPQPRTSQGAVVFFLSFPALLIKAVMSPCVGETLSVIISESIKLGLPPSLKIGVPVGRRE